MKSRDMTLYGGALLLIGFLLAGCGGGVETPQANVIYVSSPANGGDDSNDGSQLAPLASITAAIADLVAAGIAGDVRVSQGTYEVEYQSGTEVQLAEGISLYGGYSPADWSLRDPATYVTVISDISTQLGSTGNPNRAIYAGADITTVTVIDGFTINGGRGDHSSGIFVESGGAPTIANNIINGGSVKTTSNGIYIRSSSPTIRDNIINGGSGGASVFGINNNIFASPIIEGNIIVGGSGVSSAYGIYNINNSSPTIRNNTITPGSSGLGSYGISNITSSSPTIENNTINGGGGVTASYVISNSYESSPMIRNNIINGSGGDYSYGVYSSYSSSPTIQDNTINGGNANNYSCGINHTSSTGTIQGNTINGGSGNDRSYGIYNYTSASPTIRNNIVNGGSGGESYGITSYSASAPIIENNTVNGGSGGTKAYGIELRLTSTATIENNIIFTGDTATSNYCIIEGDASSDPASVRNNDLFSCSTGLYHDEGTTDITALADVNALVSTSGNIFADPLFADIDGADDDITTMGDNDWRLTASSPTSVTTGGIDGGLLGEDWGFTTDIDGVNRTGDNTMGWSMGAYEY